MPVLVRIPTPLRRLTGGEGEVTVDVASVKQLLDALEERFPGMKERLCDEQGQLRRFVNIYINDEDIRFAQGADTALKEGDEVSIVPAIAGGAPSSADHQRLTRTSDGARELETPARPLGGLEDAVSLPHRPPYHMETPWQA